MVIGTPADFDLSTFSVIFNFNTSPVAQGLKVMHFPLLTSALGVHQNYLYRHLKAFYAYLRLQLLLLRRPQLPLFRHRDLHRRRLAPLRIRVHNQCLFPALRMVTVNKVF